MKKSSNHKYRNAVFKWCAMHDFQLFMLFVCVCEINFWNSYSIYFGYNGVSILYAVVSRNTPSVTTQHTNNHFAFAMLVPARREMSMNATPKRFVEQKTAIIPQFT